MATSENRSHDQVNHTNFQKRCNEIFALCHRTAMPNTLCSKGRYRKRMSSCITKNSGLCLFKASGLGKIQPYLFTLPSYLFIDIMSIFYIAIHIAIIKAAKGLK